jgi:RNA polymerase sigma factor (sigma-70 family)
VVGTPAGSSTRGLFPAPTPPIDLATLFDQERAHLLRLAATLTQDQDEAQDVVQDAFANLQRRAGLLTDPQRAAGYLRVSVINGARSLHRRRALFRRHARPDVALAPPADTPLLLREEYVRVVDAVRRLPRRQQQVMVLRYWSELPDDQIAAALGISEVSVRSTASRAIRALAGRLEVSS